MTTLPKVAVKEEDLDDLDDVLDQFSPKTPPPTQDSNFPPATPNSPSPFPISSGRPRNNTRADQLPKPTPGGPALQSTAEEDEVTKAFTQELEMEMENLVKDFATQMDKDKDVDPKTDEEASKILKAAWEAMLVEEMDGSKPPSETQANKPTTSNDFQEKIKQTMEKLKQNDTNAAPSSSSDGEDDFQKLLQAAMSGAGTEGGEDEAELAGFLENMMGQLMSKEVLYEPLKDLEEKFPPYLAKPPTTLSAEDKAQYENQLACIKKILAVFDKADYDDKNTESSKLVVDLMSEMQTYGSPPKEVMGDMPPGFGLGAEGMPEGCIVS